MDNKVKTIPFSEARRSIKVNPDLQPIPDDSPFIIEKLEAVTEILTRGSATPAIRLGYGPVADQLIPPPRFYGGEVVLYPVLPKQPVVATDASLDRFRLVWSQARQLQTSRLIKKIITNGGRIYTVGIGKATPDQEAIEAGSHVFVRPIKGRVIGKVTGPSTRKKNR